MLKIVLYCVRYICWGLVNWRSIRCDQFIGLSRALNVAYQLEHSNNRVRMFFSIVIFLNDDVGRDWLAAEVSVPTNLGSCRPSC